MGNTRVTFADLNSNSEVDETEILQQNHYYPFGMNMEGSWSGGTNKYQYNGIERVDELGLDWNIADFRSYDPAIGRWLNVDPLAEIAPELTPYRNAFNNPFIYTDPFGLFETRKEVKEHRKNEGIEGKIKKQKDGSFTIVHKGNNGRISTFNDSEFGVITEITFAQKKNPGGTIQPRESNNWERFQNNNFATGIAYGILDGAWLVTQRFNPFDTHTTHLVGHYASNPEYTNAFVNTSLTLVPLGRGTAAVKSVVPEGLTVLNRLNATQYSKLFKGTMLASMHPKTRGLMNRLMNKAIDQVNKKVETGNAVFSGAKAANTAQNKDE